MSCKNAHGEEVESRLAAGQAANEAYVKKEYAGESFVTDLAAAQPANTYAQGITVPSGVKVAKSRIPVNSRQRAVLVKELAQAGILAGEGKSVYLIPERGGDKGESMLDALVDGELFEFRTVSG